MNEQATNEQAVGEQSHPVRDLDDRIHQRARLGVMAILSEVERADFGTIRSTLELTPGNLSQHLSVLEEAGFVKVKKTIESKRVRTWVSATAAGRAAYRAELESLRVLLDRLDGGEPSEWERA